MNLFSKLQPKLSTQEEAKALPDPHYLRGCFTKGLYSGHGPFGPSSQWLERLGAIFLEEGSEFMVPYVRERKEGGSNASPLLLWACDSVQLQPLTRKGQGSVILVASTNMKQSISAAPRAESIP